MTLTATQLRNLKPADKPIKLWDGGGLHLVVSPSGSMTWRYKYRHLGKEQLLTFGRFPAVGLADARELHRQAQAQLAQGINPATAKRQAQENTFQAVADRFLTRNQDGWGLGHTKRVRNRIEKDLVPVLGRYPVTDITAPLILEAVRQVEGRGAVNTAHRVLGMAGQVLRFAIAEGLITHNPARDLNAALLPKPRVQHHPAPTTGTAAREVWQRIDRSWGNPSIKGAVQMLILTLSRVGEVRGMRWDQIDWERREWRYTVGKTGVEHIVPLPSQAITILERLQPITGHTRWVFQGMDSNDQISPVAPVNYLRENCGFDTKNDLDCHGFRAMGRTVIAEELEYPPEWIEVQLSHTPKEAHGSAYNRVRFRRQRHDMMQAWADYLCS